MGFTIIYKLHLLFSNLTTQIKLHNKRYFIGKYILEIYIINEEAEIELNF